MEHYNYIIEPLDVNIIIVSSYRKRVRIERQSRKIIISIIVHPIYLNPPFSMLYNYLLMVKKKLAAHLDLGLSHKPCVRKSFSV